MPRRSLYQNSQLLTWEQYRSSTRNISSRLACPPVPSCTLLPPVPSQPADPNPFCSVVRTGITVNHAGTSRFLPFRTKGRKQKGRKKDLLSLSPRLRQIERKKERKIQQTLRVTGTDTCRRYPSTGIRVPVMCQFGVSAQVGSSAHWYTQVLHI